ncbi:hypothetical protein D3C78_1653730 [compost metagenome]
MISLAKSLAEINDMKKEYSDDSKLMQLLNTDEEKITESINYCRWLLKLIESFENGKIFEFIPKEES